MQPTDFETLETAGPDSFNALRERWLVRHSPAALIGGPAVLEFGDGKVFMLALKRVNLEGPCGRLLIKLVDVDQTGEQVGEGTVAYRPHLVPEADDVPFVARTNTYAEQCRRGYGTRRLIIMNYLADLYFKLPLHSDIRGNTSEPAQGRWRRLVREGLAEEYEPIDDKPRWRFKS